MRILTAGLLALILAVSGVAGESQDDWSKNRLELHLTGGLTHPVGPDTFSECWERELNLGLGVGFLLTPNFAFVVLLENHFFTGNTDGVEKIFRTNAVIGHSDIILVSATLRASLWTYPSPVQPYVCSGLGLLSLKRGAVTDYHPPAGKRLLLASHTDVAPSIHGGTGIAFAYSDRVSVFFEGEYVVGFTEGRSTQVLPFRIGLIYSTEM